MNKIDNVFEKVVLFGDKDDGTYDYLTEQAIEYDDGYQVSFVRPEAFEKLSKQQWDFITNHLCEYLESVAHIGVYGGSVEVSFHCIPMDKAIDTMVKYNQESILDWKNKKLFPQTTENWFIINRLFDEGRVVNYDEIIKQI